MTVARTVAEWADVLQSNVERLYAGTLGFENFRWEQRAAWDQIELARMTGLVSEELLRREQAQRAETVRGLSRWIKDYNGGASCSS